MVEIDFAVKVAWPGSPGLIRATAMSIPACNRCIAVEWRLCLCKHSRNYVPFRIRCRRRFFKAEGGGASRRKASIALSSTIHSTDSPRENSIA